MWAKNVTGGARRSINTCTTKLNDNKKSFREVQFSDRVDSVTMNLNNLRLRQQKNTRIILPFVPLSFKFVTKIQLLVSVKKFLLSYMWAECWRNSIAPRYIWETPA